MLSPAAADKHDAGSVSQANTTDHSFELSAAGLDRDPVTISLLQRLPLSHSDLPCSRRLDAIALARPSKRSRVDPQGLAGLRVGLVEPCYSLDEFATDSIHGQCRFAILICPQYTSLKADDISVLIRRSLVAWVGSVLAGEYVTVMG